MKLWKTTQKSEHFVGFMIQKLCGARDGGAQAHTDVFTAYF
ncbi:indole-3-glycerol-phosphate synthase [Marinobacter algicola DG893]|uniref:Indole-3-glycerol-phosphate synthase n=1 Tax=Marinobacter algicola DG893 TaxID=443152 RepID=A6F0H9_9GAMM|nr:indole-3-glycerol-phosphate synthase [Marinobacter algicola DG893]